MKKKRREKRHRVITRRSQRSRDDQLQHKASDNACYCALQQTASSKQLIFCQGDSESASIYGGGGGGWGGGGDHYRDHWSENGAHAGRPVPSESLGEAHNVTRTGEDKKNKKTRVTAHSASL